MKRRELLAGGLALGALGGCAVPAEGSAPGATGPASPLRRIAFDSCFDQTQQQQPIWAPVLADRPDLFIFGGDNVYCGMPYSLAKLRRAYAQAAESEGMARLRRSVPHLAIWDDHDMGVNDGGADFPFKSEAKAEFLDFWRIAAGDPRRTRDGLYHAQVFGPPGQRVQVILLDARWFRSPWKVTDRRDAPGKERYLPDPDPGKTMLGEVQWRWLEAQLAQPAQVRLIVSGIQVVTDGHGWERWGNFPLERRRLYQSIAEARANGVVFLSGDRHIGALYRETAGTPYPFYEMTASGITHTWREAAEDGPNRLGALFTELHYGVVDIDWDARALRLAIKDTGGAVQRSRSIAFQELEAFS
ncbi:MAG: PhoD-like phosphatase [Ramlibacter sp.]|nr:PhoD-like phosphatase [Ramlibacter sp.]